MTMPSMKIVRKQKNVKLIVRRLANKKYRAYLVDDTTVRSTGRSLNKCIGQIVIEHPQIFGVEVEKVEDLIQNPKQE